MLNQVRGAINQPKGAQKPHIPMLIGGGEKVTLKLVAQYAVPAILEVIFLFYCHRQMLAFEDKIE